LASLINSAHWFIHFKVLTMRHLSLLVVLLLGAAPGLAAPAISGIDLAGIDTAMRPGDDFDGYANEGWRAKTEIPADRATTGVGYEVFKVAEARTAALIASAAAERPAPGTAKRRIADYHAAFYDTAGIEARGLAPLAPALAEVKALTSKTELARVLGAALRADTDVLNATDLATENLFGLFVTQGLTKPDTTMPYLLQGGLGMPDRDYYVATTPAMADLRIAYQAYIAKVLGLAGVSEPEARAARIMALETQIAKSHATIVDTFDPYKVQLWMRADFARKAPGMDWEIFWSAAGLPDQGEFHAWQPGAVTGIAALVGSEPLETWKDWLLFHRINMAASVLPKAFDDASFGFYGTTLNGTPAKRAREKRAIAAVNAALGDDVGQAYVAQHFPASSRRDIEAMVANILAAFDKRVAALDWMAPVTKAEARRKIATMKVGIGYGDHWRDDSTLEIRADDPLGNMTRAALHQYHHQRAKIGKPVDRSEWWMTPQTVNALNLPLQNALNFPAAFLEPPYFDPRADAAANYGAIGAVIGHEISHSFDSLGAEFDSQGRLRNWWTAEDKARFNAQAEALVKQYDGYEALPGLFVNGRQTLGENIADVAGLAAAFDAWQASLGGKPAPVIDGKTGEQRFFIAFAQAWRAKHREKALRSTIATDGHAPARYRAQTVRNIDGWYDAFGVKPGEKLHLPPEKRVKVW
jgi:putative endopeptidase